MNQQATSPRDLEDVISNPPVEIGAISQEERVDAEKKAQRKAAKRKNISLRGWRGKDAPGLTIERRYTKPGEDVYAGVTWDYRTAKISDESGKTVFEQEGVEVPAFWSDLATKVVVNKYFRGAVGTPERETSVRQVIYRVAHTMADWGREMAYFATDEDAQAFEDELTYMLLHQMGAFNSPVWFNVGVTERPQGSACQPYDAMVSTPEGLIPIGKLVEDDARGKLVYDSKGVTRIVATKQNGRKPVLRLHTKAGYYLDVTADHLVWKKKRSGNAGQEPVGEFVPAGTLRVNDRLVWYRTPLAGKSIEGSPQEMEAALAGWLQSDGFVGQYESGTNRSLTLEAITVNNDEEQWVSSALNVVFPQVHSHSRYVVTRDPNLDCKRTRLYGEELRAFVDRWNLLARGTTMQVPTSLFTAPYAVAAAYLRSVFQAEGYVSVRENAHIGLDMISEDLVKGIQKLLLRFGVYSRVRFKSDKRDDRKGCWSLTIRTLGDRKMFAQEIGFVGAVKQQKLLNSLAMPGLEAGFAKSLEIAKIEQMDEMDVFDIQTESGEYLSGNIRVHNCFINSVEDSMDSILDLFKTEGNLFKYGSGTGTNFSTLRAEGEPLTGGGTSSGPLSYMRGLDRSAGAIRSGGKCLAPYQHVYTAEGPIPVEELARRENFSALSYHPPTGQYTAKKASAWMSGHKQVVRVHTECGQFDVSSDHPIKLSSGEYCAAGQLLAGTSLFACSIDSQAARIATSLVHSVEVLSTMDVYDVEVECPTADDKSPATGHNFVIWDGKSACGTGIVVANTRRSAKMCLLDVDHPDVLKFIDCKKIEEQKAWALIDAGYSGMFNALGGAYDSVDYQNANHSVRVTDEFMQAYEEDGEFSTRWRISGEVAETYSAREIMRHIAEAAHVCGDPGMQYDTTINRWHTCKNTDRIYASNPCSEFVFLDNTSCNLASINLMKFTDDDRNFDTDAFRHAVRLFITAQEILVDNASYPTVRIAENSHDYRPLGLGYCNVGALLMARGVPYDSPEGRAYAAAITAIMTGEAYRQSAVIARDHGWAFPGFEKNREPMLEVMQMHRDAVEEIGNFDREDLPIELYRAPIPQAFSLPENLLNAARNCWNEAIELGHNYGYRNAQATVLAPTGTISFMLDADTTGVEPDIAIVKYKTLVGGGMLKIVNRTVPEALVRLGYTSEQVEAILAHIETQDTIEGAPGFKDEHLPVFDCAFKAQNGTRSIEVMGHVKMMAATQPFLSGAISKTCNTPNEATVDDIVNVYAEAWKLGLKAIAIYRDGSKRTQPLMTTKAEESLKSEGTGTGLGTLSEREIEVIKSLREGKGILSGPNTVTSPPVSQAKIDAVTKTLLEAQIVEPTSRRIPLPDERHSITHKFNVGNHEGYLTVGMYADGRPGEIFITMSKMGSTISGLMDSLATAVSIGLQYGVPLATFVSKFQHQRYEPAGFTAHPQIRIAKSIVDYIFRWLDLKFPDGKAPVSTSALFEIAAEIEANTPITVGADRAKGPDYTVETEIVSTFQNQADAPACADCGSIMVRNGACYRCPNCGSVYGCS